MQCSPDNPKGHVLPEQHQELTKFVLRLCYSLSVFLNLYFNSSKICLIDSKLDIACLFQQINASAVTYIYYSEVLF